VIQIKTLFIILIGSATTLLIVGNMELSFGQTYLNIDDTKLKTNSINLTEPIYQAITGVNTTKGLSSTPLRVTEESAMENAVMKNIGNVTNNATFTKTYLSDGLIQCDGRGTIETEDGQSIDWISSGIHKDNGKGLFFHGIILFNNTSSEKLSFLNNAVGVYKDSPEVKRTIWLLK
jgi:hypothetical protein